MAALSLGGAASCSGPQRTSEPTGSGLQPPPAATDPRSPIERRRDAACEQLGPKLTACAVEDARADLAAGKTNQRQFDLDTAHAVQRRHTEEFEKRCKAASYSSRQIRVLAVCVHEETQCRPLLDCLGHLSDRVPGSGGK